MNEDAFERIKRLLRQINSYERFELSVSYHMFTDDDSVWEVHIKGNEEIFHRDFFSYNKLVSFLEGFLCALEKSI